MLAVAFTPISEFAHSSASAYTSILRPGSGELALILIPAQIRARIVSLLKAETSSVVVVLDAV